MKRLFHALSGTEDGAFVIDGQHRIVFWNKAAEAILKYTAAEAVGRPCFEILGGRDAQGLTLCQRYCQIAIRADNGEPLPNNDVYARTATGEGRWLNVTTFVYPSADKNIEGTIVHLFRDATERKNYQRFVDRVLTASEELQQDDGPRAIPTPLAGLQTGRLTARQRQVLQLLARGLSTDEIAKTLVISPATVRNHVQNILNELGVHSRLEAITFAYQQGLIEIDSS